MSPRHKVARDGSLVGRQWPRARLRPGRADDLDADRPGDHRGAGDAVRQHQRQQPRARAGQQHDRKRPLRDQGAGGRSRPRGLLGRATCRRSTTRTCDRRPPPRCPTAVPDPCSPMRDNWDAAYKTNLIGIPVQAYDDDGRGSRHCVGPLTSSTNTRPVRTCWSCAMSIPCVPGVGAAVATPTSPASSTCSPAFARPMRRHTSSARADTP